MNTATNLTKLFITTFKRYVFKGKVRIIEDRKKKWYLASYEQKGSWPVCHYMVTSPFLYPNSFIYEKISVTSIMHLNSATPCWWIYMNLCVKWRRKNKILMFIYSGQSCQCNSWDWFFPVYSVLYLIIASKILILEKQQEKQKRKQTENKWQLLFKTDFILAMEKKHLIPISTNHKLKYTCFKQQMILINNNKKTQTQTLGKSFSFYYKAVKIMYSLIYSSF